MIKVLLLPAYLDANPAMPENLHKKTPVFCRRRALVFVKNTGSRTRLFGNPAILSAFAKASADFGPVVLRHRITPVLPVSETKLRM
jgi:hypothetical protein